MRILIDTHVLIWYLNGDDRLSPRLIKVIENEQTKVVISVVSLWELAIKINSENFNINITLQDIERYVSGHEVELLNIHFKALHVFSKLPYHHGDPFDRMLISQSISENLSVISVDRHFPSYNINLIK